MRSRWVPGPFACGGPHKEASFQARCSPGACLRGAPPPPTSLPDPWRGSPERRWTSRVPVFLRGKPPARLGASPRLLLLRHRDRRLPILSAGTAAGRRETSRSPRPRPPGNLGCQLARMRGRPAVQARAGDTPRYGATTRKPSISHRLGLDPRALSAPRQRSPMPRAAQRSPVPSSIAWRRLAVRPREAAAAARGATPEWHEACRSDPRRLLA